MLLSGSLNSLILCNIIGHLLVLFTRFEQHDLSITGWHCRICWKIYVSLLLFVVDIYSSMLQSSRYPGSPSLLSPVTEEDEELREMQWGDQDVDMSSEESREIIE